MRNTGIKVGLLLSVLIFVPFQEAGAISINNNQMVNNPLAYKNTKLTEDSAAVGPNYSKAKRSKESEQSKLKHKKSSKAKSNATKRYKVKSGDTLTKIAKQNRTTWPRLFAKNKQIANPNNINVGQVIVIPKPKEKLAARPLATLATPAPVTTSVVTQSQAASSPATTYVGSSAGNTYAPGYCTWYAKSRRPDLPNMMGDAINWVASAAAHGFATGATPRAGAIGQQGNHVVYVERVNSNGTVEISEMNYQGLYVVSSRTVPASNFTYIY